MFAFDMATASDLLQIIWLDVVLSGDNALVIGMAAAALAPHLQRKAILFGMILATAIRIVAAMAATYLYAIPWVKFVGGAALLWVAWKLWREALALNRTEPAPQSLSAAAVDPAAAGAEGATDRKSIIRALVTITIADVSMSIDNVLAVAGVAHGNQSLLIFGLALSIFLMAFFATMICRFLVRNPWISFVGVAVLVYVGAEMIWSSWPDMRVFIGLD